MLKDKNLYLVGGSVRDSFLGINSIDLDFCYQGNAIEFAQQYEIIKTNEKLCTARIIYNNKEIDIASTRTEYYPKVGHLPEIQEIGVTLEKDVKRRDFTINTLYKNTLTEKIIDYYNGLNDIKNKTIRVLHDKSFIEDPSRIIRALKFASRFNFSLEKHTKNLMIDYLDNVNYDMSYPRIKKELVETFNFSNDVAYDLFVQNNIYKLLSASNNYAKIQQNISSLITKYKTNFSWLLYLGSYDLSRLNLTKGEKEIINKFHEICNIIPNDDYQIYKLFNNCPLETVLLYAIYTDEHIAIKYLDKLKNIQVFITGDDLKNIGFYQGEIFKKIFNKILFAKIKKPNLTKEDEIEIAKEYKKC